MSVVDLQTCAISIRSIDLIFVLYNNQLLLRKLLTFRITLTRIDHLPPILYNMSIP